MGIPLCDLWNERHHCLLLFNNSACSHSARMVHADGRGRKNYFVEGNAEFLDRSGRYQCWVVVVYYELYLPLVAHSFLDVQEKIVSQSVGVVWFNTIGWFFHRYSPSVRLRLLS